MYQIMVYRDKVGQYRWTMRHKGRIVADCAEGYHRLAWVMRALNSMFKSLFQPGNWSVEIDPTAKEAYARYLRSRSRVTN